MKAWLIALGVLLAGCVTDGNRPAPRETGYINVPKSEMTKADWTKAVVLIKERGGAGTGFFINVPEKRFIITARHVANAVRPATTEIISEDLDVYTIAGVDASEKTDAAIMYLDRIADEPGFNLDCREPNFQEQVWIIGHPMGIAEEVITTGKIASTKRMKHPQISAISGVILDVRASPGNSGSPVVDKDGNVIGILVAGIPGGGVTIMVPIVDVCKELGLNGK